MPSPAPSGGMNVDPDAPYLGPATEENTRDVEAQQQVQDVQDEGEDENRFVGGFKFGARRLMRAMQGASIQWGSGSRQAQGIDYSPPYAVSRQEEGAGSERPSASLSDDTMHYGSPTEDGTTAVDHTYQPQYIAPEVIIGSPEFVEPLPAPDYRKMASPSETASDVSLHSYFSRVKKFIHDINSLPWVAEDRVTVDYYPGQTKKRVREKAPYGTAPKHRSAIATSWYGDHYRNYKPSGTLDVRELDLTAGDSPEVRTVQPSQSLPGVIQPFTDGNGQVWPAIADVMYQDQVFTGDTPVQDPVTAPYSPMVNPAATPIMNPVVTPGVYHAAIPFTNPTATPRINPTTTPRMNPTTTPRINPTSTPRMNPTTTPRMNPITTPRMNPTTVPEMEPTATQMAYAATSPPPNPAAEPETPPMAYNYASPRSNTTGLASPRPTQYPPSVPQYHNGSGQMWPVVSYGEPVYEQDTTPVIPPTAHIPDGVYVPSAATGQLH